VTSIAGWRASVQNRILLNGGNRLEGYLDTEGNVVIQPSFFCTCDFFGNWSYVCDESNRYRYYLLNKNGKKKKLRYKDSGQEPIEIPTSNGIFAEDVKTYKLNKEWSIGVAYFDTSGKRIYTSHDDNRLIVSENMGWVRLIKDTDTAWWEFNSESQWELYTIRPEFSRVGSFNLFKANEFGEGVAAVKTSAGWHFVNNSGNAINNLVYEDVYRWFSNGLCMVKKNGSWIFIDKQGTTVIKIPGMAPIHEIFDFYMGHNIGSTFQKGGLAFVLINGIYSYINLKGEIVWKEK
jgi:hypothetical protein